MPVGKVRAHRELRAPPFCGRTLLRVLCVSDPHPLWAPDALLWSLSPRPGPGLLSQPPQQEPVRWTFPMMARHLALPVT